MSSSPVGWDDAWHDASQYLSQTQQMTSALRITVSIGSASTLIWREVRSRAWGFGPSGCFLAGSWVVWDRWEKGGLGAGGLTTHGRDSYSRVGYQHDGVFVGNGPLSSFRASPGAPGGSVVARSVVAGRSSCYPCRVPFSHRPFLGVLVVYRGQAPAPAGELAGGGDCDHVGWLLARCHRAPAVMQTLVGGLPPGPHRR
jgi:hypothetical protein